MNIFRKPTSPTETPEEPPVHCMRCPGNPVYPASQIEHHKALHGPGLAGWPWDYRGLTRYSNVSAWAASGQIHYEGFTRGQNGGWRPLEAYGPVGHE